MTKEEIENYFVESAGYGRDKVRNFMDIVDKALEQKGERITELERKLEQTEKDLADYQFNYPTIKELEKENAELKEKLGNYQKGMFDEIEKRDINLTKAKEILQKFVDWANWQGNSKCPSFKSIQDKAEQFLKE